MYRIRITRTILAKMIWELAMETIDYLLKFNVNINLNL